MLKGENQVQPSLLNSKWKILCSENSIKCDWLFLDSREEFDFSEEMKNLPYQTLRQRKGQEIRIFIVVKQTVEYLI